MFSGSKYTIRVSRKILLVLFLVGALFLLAGLDLAVLHKVFPVEFGAEKQILKWIFTGFAVLTGFLIVVTEGAYLILPPVMLRVTTDTLIFGTGLRYRPFRVPLRDVLSVETFTSESMVEVMGKRKVGTGGISLYLSSSSSLPAGMATSAGIQYANYTLQLLRPYMNKKPEEAVQEIRRFLQ